MKTPSSIALVILGSVWFSAVSFFCGTRLGMEIICHFDHCSRDMTKGDSPHRQFEVMVRLPSDSQRVVSVLLQELPLFIKKHPNALLILPVGNGSAEGWDYVALPEVQNRQHITARKLNDVGVDVEYQVSGSSVSPLSSKVISPGHLFSSMPFGFILVWLIRFLVRKRLNKLATAI